MIGQYLSIRIAVVVGLIALLGAILASLSFYQRIQSLEVASARRTAWQLAQTVQNTASIAAYLDNAELADEVIQGLASNEIVSGVSLTSVTGLSVRLGSAAREHGEEPVHLELESPFTPGQRVGELAIYPRQALIEARARDVALVNAGFLGGYTLLIALLAMAFIQWQFVPVLRRLASQLHEIEPGSQARLMLPKRHRQDEIGRLVLDINRLLEIVKDKLNGERVLREEIQDLARRFRLMYERASAGIFLLGEDGQVLMANPAFHELVGQGAVSANETNDSGRYAISALFADVEPLMAMARETIRLGKPTSADLRLARGMPETPRWVHCLLTRISDDTSEPSERAARLQGIVTDITDRKRIEDRMRFQAECDPLTHLANRRAAEIQVGRMLEVTRIDDRCVAICLIDLDNFKPINDTYGHDAGDRVLKTVAERLLGAIRDDDMAARLGGDEFLVAMRHVVDRADIESVARRILEALTHPIDLGDGVLVRVGASLGIALSCDHGDDLSHLMITADRAMYQVKSRGKQGFQVAARPESEAPHRTLDPTPSRL